MITMKTIDMIIKLVQSLGFPILVAVWFMFRTDKRLEKQNDLINALLQKLEQGDDND